MGTPSKPLILIDESGLDEAASSLLQYVENQRIIAFYGELGAGKTTLIKAVCRKLGVQDSMSSPTFSIVNEYRDLGANPVYHFDFYRIQSEAEALDIGIDEYFDSGHFCLIEWPEKILNLLPKPIMKVMIRTENNTRLISFSYE